MAGYYIHYNTTNKTWLQRSIELKKLGIKNNDFFLKLYDIDLMNVNPFDEDNITEELATKIVLEIIKNPWYFYREILRFPVTGGSTRLLLDIGTLSYLYLAEMDLNILREQTRQTGKTYGAIARYSRVFSYIALNSTFMFGNKQNKDAMENIKRLKDVIALFPSYLKPDINDSIEYIRNFTTNSRVIMMNTPGNPETAETVGRGLNCPHIWWDEWAFTPYSSVIYFSSVPAVNTARKFARENNAPSGINITTTPNDLDSTSGKFCYNMMKNAAEWNIIMFDWTKEEIVKYIDANSENNYVHIRYLWSDLGYSQQWYDELCKDMLYDWGKIKREVNLKWGYASDKSVFLEADLEAVDKVTEKYPQDKIYTLVNAEKHMNYLFYLYDEIDPTLPYLLSLDVSGGEDNDRTALCVFHPYTRKLVALMFSSNLLIPYIEDMVHFVMTTWLKRSFIAIERNNQGLGIIQHITTEQRFKQIADSRLFYTYKSEEVKSHAEKKTEDVKRHHKYEKNDKKVYGIDTTGISRAFMIDNLFLIVAEHKDWIVSVHLFNEIKTLVRNNRGKIVADNDAYDDIVMSFLLGHYAFAQNTIKYFIRNNKEIEDISKQASSIIKYNNTAKEDLINHDNELINKPFNNEDEKPIRKTNNSFLNKIISFNNKDY